MSRKTKLAKEKKVFFSEFIFLEGALPLANRVFLVFIQRYRFPLTFSYLTTFSLKGLKRKYVAKDVQVAPHVLGLTGKKAYYQKPGDLVVYHNPTVEALFAPLQGGMKTFVLLTPFLLFRVALYFCLSF